MNDSLARQVETESVRLDFLSRAAKDRAAGELRSLAEYLALFPGHQEEVARAWLGLQGAAASAPGEEAGERRIGPTSSTPSSSGPDPELFRPERGAQVREVGRSQASEEGKSSQRALTRNGRAAAS